MQGIDHLLPDSSKPIADREMMLREVLVARVREWLSASHFATCRLPEMRAIARDIQGMPFLRAPLPMDLEALGGIDFASLSPANRRLVVMKALNYAGFGSDLYGADKWSALQGQIDRLCAGPQESPRGSTLIPDEWALDTICDLVGGVFLEKRFFNICHVASAYEALQSLRMRAALPALGAKDADQRWATLQMLHCTDFKDMSSTIKNGLVPAIVAVLGLDRADTATLLGQARLEALVAVLHGPGFVEQTAAGQEWGLKSTAPTSSAPMGALQLPVLALLTLALIICGALFWLKDKSSARNPAVACTDAEARSPGL